MNDQPLRVGIIGCGNVVIRDHIPALQQLKTVGVVAISDPLAARRQQALSLLNLPASVGYESHRDMLAQADLDYAVLATPPSLRSGIMRDCAAAGVHILSEKPVSTSPRDAHLQAEIMEAAGVKLGFVHNYLFYPEYVRIRRLLDAGAIGSVRHIAFNFLGVPDKPGNQDYDPDWRHQPGAAGGGVLMDMIHAVYLAEFLIKGEILAVSAVIDNLGYPNGRVEDLALLHLYFKNGYAAINMGWGHGPGGVEIAGSNGRILAFYRDYRTGPFEKLESLACINPTGRTDWAGDDRHQGVDNFVAIHQDFAEAIRQGRAPIAPVSVAIRILEAVLAAYTSARQGRVIELPFPKTHPVYLKGVAGLADLPAWENSPLVQRGLFLAERSA